MTEGVIYLLREDENAGEFHFRNRTEMKEKPTSLTKQIERMKHKNLYQLSIILKTVIHDDELV